jgi:geranyl-CoA carboxylase alpha subunit
MPDITKLLIANRGEIALRIQRTARDMGLSTVAVYSEADAKAPHVKAANEAIAIGPARASESYLSIAAIVDAARQSRADAVHPGYGFLSENADFARACADAGLIFIGPDSEAIRLMGDKRLAKQRMRDAGIPCVPGWDGEDQDDPTIVSAASDLGFPLMVKAAAGGGGRGMRLVTDADGIGGAITSARSEAQDAFGDGTLILERAVSSARHIEVQIFGDRHNNIVHLGARDCSVQRRHQKVIEEAPPPDLSTTVLEALYAAAIDAAAAIDYVGAGTVEFLVGPNEEFYFLEMNTRLQVEHAVTEMITGEDLVAWQILVARGEPLPKSQKDIQTSGHAIEARLYAEDTDDGFLPQSGPVLLWKATSKDRVRVESGIETGSVISPYYDPMVAKIIAHGDDREHAIRRLTAVLKSTALLGTPTNKRFLLGILADVKFQIGAVSTDFIDLQTGADTEDAALETAVAALLLFKEYCDITDNIWWSSGPARWVMMIGVSSQLRKATITVPREASAFDIEVDGQSFTIESVEVATNLTRLKIDGADRDIVAAKSGAALWLDLGEGARAYEDLSYVPAVPLELASDGVVAAPITGRAVQVVVKEGDVVAVDDVLLIIEAMKIEHAVLAPIAGTVTLIAAKEGDQIAARTQIVEIAPGEASERGG